MHISLITFHDVSNFGATLQCTALSTYLKKLGHETEVIDYRPGYVADQKSPLKFMRQVKRIPNKAWGVIRGLLYASSFRKIARRNRRFESFIRDHLKLSRVYHDKADLISDPPAADLYICGSDQIWNPELTGRAFDEAFFLGFPGGRKASYAVSLGTLDVEDNAERLRTLTTDIDRISVREKTGAAKLSRAIGREVSTTLDCTLLLDKEDYVKMEIPLSISDRPYLLLYCVIRSSATAKMAKRIAGERGLKLINISPSPLAMVPGARNLTDIGPGEFLYLVAHAGYVVTNSFHGTVFSILYEKDFSCVSDTNAPGRIGELLDALGLKGRFGTGDLRPDTSPVDYSAVREMLNALRRESFDYLDSITCSSPCIDL